MKIKSLLVATVLATAILCFGGVVKAVDNSALIAQIQAQIQLLLQQIAQLQSQQNINPAWCYTFNNNLRIGDSAGDVQYLGIALQKQGFAPGAATSVGAGYYFNQQTVSAVVQFQKRYGIAQVGVVGPVTRAKLNSLYGCKITLSNSVVINSVSGPNTLNVGQTGTWSVNATAPSGTNLTYSVDWGDQPIYAANMGAPAPVSFQNVASFTHSYGQAGTYTINFTVKSTRLVQCLMYPCGDPVEDIARTSITVVVGNAVCAAEGTRALGLMAVPAVYCCAGLSGLNTTILPAGATGDPLLLCYNPSNGQPTCKAGNAGNGWFYPNGTLLKAENCTPSSPSITVTSPNGGEVWTARSIQTIRWAGINKTVDLYLDPEPPACVYSNPACLLPTRAPYVLDRNIFSQNSVYNWIVATDIINLDIPAGQYRMRICTAGSQTDCDVSNNYFSIIAPSAQPSITVTSPNGGESFRPGQQITISWNSSNLNQLIGITLLGQNNSQFFLGNWVNGYLGYETVVIPNTVLPGNYKVNIATPPESSPSAEDESNNYFSIVAQ